MPILFLRAKNYRHIAEKHTYIVEGIFWCAAAKRRQTIYPNSKGGNCSLLQKQKEQKEFRKNHLFFGREVSV